MKTLIALLSAALLAACQAPANNVQAVANQSPASSPAAANQASTAPQGGETTASGLRIETLSPGTGPRPRLGEVVMVTYEGRLIDGTMFDSSPAPVQMTVGELVPGFDEGLTLMNQGGRYRLHIPSALAYGAQGAGGVVPPNADLIFDVTLVEIAGAAGR